MSKKKLIDGDVFSAMTGSVSQPQTRFVPQPPEPESPPAARKSTEMGLPDGMIRATIIARKDVIEKCRDIAYWDRLRDQDVYTAAMLAFIDQYEKRTGRPVEPRPDHAKRTLVRTKSS